jgi:putative membrane protein
MASSDRRESFLTDEQGEGSGERTALAEDRTLLANERTFAGWMRTSLAAVAIGIGFNALFPTMEPKWVPKAIATIFLLIGIYVMLSAERRGAAVIERLQPHEIKPVQMTNMRLVSWSIALATLALIAAFWLLGAQ